jgi:hypothetical protein
MKFAYGYILGAALVLGVAAIAACTASASASAGSGSTCAQDSTVTCNDGTGYSCTGNDAPQDSDSSIVCDYGQPGNAGSTTYCCLNQVASSSTSCGYDSTVAGCVPGSFGFSCADANEPPNAAYPSLTCSTEQQGNAGAAIYCCTDGTTVNDQDSGGGSNTCALDQVVSCDGGQGYSCLGSDTPIGQTCSLYSNDDAGISEYCCNVN